MQPDPAHPREAACRELRDRHRLLQRALAPGLRCHLGGGLEEAGGTASVAGQMQIAAQGATVDINDSVMTNNLQALGTIRANQSARQTDIANLEAATQSQDVSQQTIMAELQRINQALLLELRTQQDANQINANLALQQIVAQKQQQDAMKSAFRDSAGYESYYNANIATTSGGAANLLTQAY